MGVPAGARCMARAVEARLPKSARACVLVRFLVRVSKCECVRVCEVGADGCPRARQPPGRDTDVRLGAVRLPIAQLRRQVVRCADDCVRNSRRRRQLARHAKVAQAEGTVGGQEEVHRLDVPVQDLQRVQVLQPAQRFAVQPPHLRLWKQRPSPPAQHAVHVAPLAELHDDVQPAVLDKALHVGHHVRVVDRSEQLHLAQHGRLRRRRQLVEPVNLLQRILLLIGHAPHVEDRPVGSGAQLALKGEVGAHRHCVSPPASARRRLPRPIHTSPSCGALRREDCARTAAPTCHGPAADHRRAGLSGPAGGPAVPSPECCSLEPGGPVLQAA
eukprot:scaffold1670_cov108-Isochrysis_galbana.AAC.3